MNSFREKMKIKAPNFPLKMLECLIKRKKKEKLNRKMILLPLPLVNLEQMNLIYKVEDQIIIYLNFLIKVI